VSGQTVRDAMVPEPTTLDVGATAQDAAALLADSDDVRAIFVSADDGRLVGVITRKTLVREVVAAGLDPTSVRLDTIAEPPLNTLDAGLALDDAFRFLEEGDLERVPVVEDGRLVGVLSRSVVQRRLAEDEPPEDGDAEDPGAVVL
jgi:CBS domain-containing protein